MFDLSLWDERYLPFEGMGAVSRWRLELPKEFPLFDYGTIRDLMLHLRYTARDGGEALKDAALGSIKNALKTMILGSDRAGLVLAVSVRRKLQHAWPGQLAAVEAPQDALHLVVPIEAADLPRPFAALPEGSIQITGVELVLLVRDASKYAADTALPVCVTPPEGAPGRDVTLTSSTTVLDGQLSGPAGGPLALTIDPRKGFGSWTFTFAEEGLARLPEPIVTRTEDGRRHGLSSEQLEDLLVLVHYMLV